MEYPCFRANVSDPLNVTLNRPCIRLDQIGDDHIDCTGGLDERNTLKYCNSPKMLGNFFQCSSTNTCIGYSYQCAVQCYGHGRKTDCSEEADFMCLNGKCAKEGWCNQIMECSYGEDELFCFDRQNASWISFDRKYRENKEPSIGKVKQTLQLPRLPCQNINEQANSTVLVRSSIVEKISLKSNFFIAYYCNRGIGVHSSNSSIVCFCPPQYYGDRCQYHLDRLSDLF